MVFVRLMCLSMFNTLRVVPGVYSKYLINDNYDYYFLLFDIFIIFFFQFHWDTINIQHFISLRCTAQLPDLCILWNDYYNEFS